MRLFSVTAWTRAGSLLVTKKKKKKIVSTQNLSLFFSLYAWQVSRPQSASHSQMYGGKTPPKHLTVSASVVFAPVALPSDADTVTV